MKLNFKKFFCSHITTILIVVVAGIIGYTIGAAYLSSIPFYKSITGYTTGIVKSLLLPVVAGIIGYIIGVAKSFREQKLKTYIDSLQIISKVVYQPEIRDQSELNKALINMCLYGNIEVFKKFDKVVSIKVKPPRGDIIKELQELIVDMRNDIQFLPCQKLLKPDDIKHLSIRLIGEPPKK